MVTGYVPPGGNKRKLILESRSHIWDEPYLFQVCFDGLLRRCVPTEEGIKIIERYHSSPYGGFFWPIMYEDTREFTQRCGLCQTHGNVNSRDAMPLIKNL